MLLIVNVSEEVNVLIDEKRVKNEYFYCVDNLLYSNIISPALRLTLSVRYLRM